MFSADNALSPDSRRFWLVHAVLPATAVALLSLILMDGRGDFAVADVLYSLQGHRWIFRTGWQGDDAIHLAERGLSILAWLAVACAWGSTHFSPRFRDCRRPLGYLALATLAGVVITSGLKSISPLDCPWDLARYGGTRNYFGLFAARPASFEGGGCFPAGHASSGYSWLALYFFLSLVRPSLRGWGLAIGAGAGLLFGFSQQMRGAHFLSHDLWAFAICWFLAVGLYALMFPAQKRVFSSGDNAAVTCEMPLPTRRAA